MLLHGGELDGQHLLSPKTVVLMRADHGGALYRASEDAYGWGSAYFPQYAVDPKERMIIVFMAQHRPAGGSNLHLRVKALAYQALIK